MHTLPALGLCDLPEGGEVFVSLSVILERSVCLLKGDVSVGGNHPITYERNGEEES